MTIEIAGAAVPSRALQGSVRDFRAPRGTGLFERCEGFFEWQDLRRGSGTWPYARATEAGPTTTCSIRDDAGVLSAGVNFASQDYLSLASHPEVRAAAHRAIDTMGLHSAGSPALVGNTSTSVALEGLIADFLAMKEALLFPTGWAAGFGAIKGLVRPNDYVVIDALAHASLLTGAQAATANVVAFRHLSVEHCRQKLAAIRGRDPEAGIMIVTESLFSMDSDTPDIAALQSLARDYQATLMVDAAHDLGCLGPGGTGEIGAQNMLGEVDIVMGSFSKTFASNGGFVAVNSRAVKEYLRYYSPSCTFSNALSPAQVAAVTRALEIVRAPEGEALRRRLMENVLALREALTTRGMTVYGDPSAIVSVRMGDEALARLAARALPHLGVIANLVEYPAVARGHARFRLQVMAGHAPGEILAAAERIGLGLRAAREALPGRLARAG